MHPTDNPEGIRTLLNIPVNKMSQPLYPSFTPTYHHSQYPAIDPTQAHLDCSDKLILVTGAGSGIGEAIATAFSKAHAKGIVLLGRNEATLQSTATKIAAESDKTEVLVVRADITSREQVHAAFTKITDHFNAATDVLINNAGGLLAFGAVADIDIGGFWKTHELNVLGPLIVTQAFIRAAKASVQPDARRAIINIPSGSAHIPYAPTAVAYSTSKLANAKVLEYVHFEHPGWLAVNLQPGVVATELARKAGRKAPDDPNLPAGMAVWLAADSRAEVLNGKFVWANWDVDELLVRKDEIREKGLLNLGLIGWADGISPEDLIGRARSVHRDADKK